MTRRPPLPTPTIIGGRQVYTAGQMIEFGQLWADMAVNESKNERYTDLPQDKHGVVDELLNVFRMKK